MVYQHFRLVDSFTVAENIVLGHAARSRGRCARARSQQRVGELVDEYGLDIHPSAYVWQLSVGEQQRVEIVKQLFRGARILILDEPTAVLAPHESDRLFDAVRHMVDTRPRRRARVAQDAGDPRPHRPGDGAARRPQRRRRRDGDARPRMR